MMQVRKFLDETFRAVVTVSLQSIIKRKGRSKYSKKALVLLKDEFYLMMSLNMIKNTSKDLFKNFEIRRICGR
jgi:hypothetical protein